MLLVRESGSGSSSRWGNRLFETFPSVVGRGRRPAEKLVQESSGIRKPRLANRTKKERRSEDSQRGAASDSGQKGWMRKRFFIVSTSGGRKTANKEQASPISKEEKVKKN